MMERMTMILNSSKYKVFILVVSLFALFVGCEYGETGLVSGPNISSWDTVGLTYDVNNGAPGGRDFYVISGGHDFVSVSAPHSNVGGNTRIAFGYSGVIATNGMETCVVFDGQTQDRAQEGVMLGWDTTVPGGRGVTLTKNIWGGAGWIINMHEWHGSSFDLVSSWDVPALHSLAMPYRFCARRDGAEVRFRVWGEGGVDPGYGDRSSGGYGVVGWSNIGLVGWYAGHLEPGHSIGYRSLDVVVW